jgi:dolichyl-phosphate-mannose--protein O-mannosyl transferase
MPTEAPKSSERWVTAVAGLLLVGIAIAIVYSVGADHSFGSFAAAAVIGWLGIDALVSAARKRRSILSRIGPLP